MLKVSVGWVGHFKGPPELNKATKVGFWVQVARHFGCWLVAPEPKYCTDNGVMIAWNGLEKFRRGKEVVRPEDAKGIQLHPRAPFGVDISARVEEANIKCAWVPIY